MDCITGHDVGRDHMHSAEKWERVKAVPLRVSAVCTDSLVIAVTNYSVAVVVPQLPLQVSYAC